MQSSSKIRKSNLNSPNYNHAMRAHAPWIKTMGCTGSRSDRGSSTRSRSSCPSIQSNWQPRSENRCLFNSFHYTPQRSMQSGCCKCGAERSRKPQCSAGCCYCSAEQPRKPQNSMVCCYCCAKEQQCADNFVEERPQCRRCASVDRCRSLRQHRRRRSCTTIQHTQRGTTYAELVIPIRACSCADQNAEDNRSCVSYNG